MPETVIVIPAFNEEKWVGRAIDLIRGTEIKAAIIVVNDGSTDRTSEIARTKGCTVIDLPKNLGKANAFFAGLKAAKRLNPKVLVTIDADTVGIPKDTLQQLIEKAASATRQNKTIMVVAPYAEWLSPLSTYELSGVRAYSRPAFFKLAVSKHKSLPKRFGLEDFLNGFFKERLVKLEASPIRQRMPMQSNASKRQSSDIIETRERMLRRGLPAKGTPRKRRRRRPRRRRP